MTHKVVFFGNERLATGVDTRTPVLHALVSNGYEIAAVVVAQNPTGKSRKVRRQEIVEAAEQYGIPVLSPIRLTDETKDELAKYKPDVGVLVAYGKKVPEDIIDIFPHGIINLHPSLLPHHRGPVPVESVILKHEQETGVTLMKLAPELDSGPIYKQKKIKLEGTETKQALADRLLTIGAEMLLECLPKILDGSLEPQEQDHTDATYDDKITKEDAELKFDEKTAEELLHEIQAYMGWPRSRAMIGTTEVVITEAHAEDINGVPGTLWLDGRRLGIHAKEGVVAIDKLIPAGKKEMSAEAFLAGYKPI